jgi:hypothetical protein
MRKRGTGLVMIQPKSANSPSRGSHRAFADTPLATGLALAACAIAGFLTAHLPPFVTSGARLSDPAQADYARNLWSNTIPSLVTVASICPLVVFGLLPPFRFAPRQVLLGVSVATLCVASLFATLALNAYRQQPIAINGPVLSFQGRDIVLCGFEVHHHLLVSDQELRQVHDWVKPGTEVLLYVTASGDAAYIGPAREHLVCATSGLGQ